ncbi:AAA family ATPase [Nonomuraea sp. NBC_00507]|uniref:MinD/ParA family ATP-binding protein n=1 Tax=Nonomuraea sp. NBC_00507 TaxID=2976002 RepID=UPI002E192488
MKRKASSGALDPDRERALRFPPPNRPPDDLSAAPTSPQSNQRPHPPSGNGTPITALPHAWPPAPSDPEAPTWPPAPSAPEPHAWTPAASEPGPHAWTPAPSEPGPHAWTPAASEPEPPAWPAAEPSPRTPAGPAQDASVWGGPPEPDETTSESLRPDRLLRNRRRPPTAGWRRLVYTISGGLIHPRPSKQERHRQELIERIRRPVAKGHYRVAVMSLKGGVGKTTTTIALGSTLAAQRGDRVIAVDANPDRGTLSDKLRLESPSTVRHLLNDRAGIKRYADVRSYTSQAPSRLEVLASDRDPAISEAFDAEDYAAVAELLDQFYSIAITDCGTGMLHSAMSAILTMADQIVLVSPVTVDGARSASATLDWLQAHGHRPLAAEAVVVLSAVKKTRKSSVDVEELKQHFAKRCRAVVGVPFDPHLEEGYEVDLDLLRPATRDTYLELASVIADGFSKRDRT